MKLSHLRRSIVAGAAALGLAGALVAAPSAQAVPTAEYLVQVGGTGPVGEALDAVLGQLGAGQVLGTFEHAIRGGLVVLPEALGTVLATVPGVTGVSPNAVVTLSDTQANPPSYGLDRIDQRDRPLNQAYTYTATGAGVTAYIIDTGIRATHNDFGGRVEAGTNTVDGGPGTADCNGHGTHVAGTVGGAVAGVAKGVTLVPVRVFGCENSTSTADIIEGVEWAIVDHQAGEPAVANMSLGGGANAALDTAVRNLIADGVTVAIASGNDGANGCSGSPARVAEGIVVGATDANDARASFSNYGTCVDVHAPGVNIVSATNANDTGTATMSGTSMATPHVTGAAALLLSGSGGTRTPATVQQLVVDNASTNRISGIKTSCTILDNLLGTCQAGTPNRLLYTGTASQPSDPPPSNPPACNALQRLLGLC